MYIICIFVAGCAVVLIIALCIIIIPYAFLDYYEHTDGQMIASTSTWFFFVLLNAFYGGALTMFFVSEIPVPFISVEDVMKAYPSWKLKMMNGNDVHFQYKAIQVCYVLITIIFKGGNLKFFKIISNCIGFFITI